MIQLFQEAKGSWILLLNILLCILLPIIIAVAIYFFVQQAVGSNLTTTRTINKKVSVVISKKFGDMSNSCSDVGEKEQFTAKIGSR